MKERPILFNGAMVRAVLAGTKTQTRRLVKPAPQMVADKTTQPWEGDADALLRLLAQSGKSCQFGQPGDRLWVRETWCGMPGEPNAYGAGHHRYYRADYEGHPFSGSSPGRWKPSIHMPRWASRITLEVTGVRVGRLQDISEEDAQAEGVVYDPGEGGTFFVPGLGCASDRAAGSFRLLWESINGPGSWDANPWLWAVEFKRVAQGEQAKENHE